jgi:hypothetical protein
MVPAALLLTPRVFGTIMLAASALGMFPAINLNKGCLPGREDFLGQTSEKADPQEVRA